MAYATVEDVQVLVGAPVDQARTTALLDLAAAMIDAYQPLVSGMTPVPTAARVVNANMVVRTLANPLGVKSEQLAAFGTTYGDATAGMTLSAADMAMLDGIGGLSGQSRHVYDIRTPSPDESAVAYPPFFVVVDP